MAISLLGCEVNPKKTITEVPTVIANYELNQMGHISRTGAIGSLDDLSFYPPTNSRWFVYSEPTPGSYRATAKTDIGSFSKNDWIQTSFSDANSDPIHTTNNVAACSELIPNFNAQASKIASPLSKALAVIGSYENAQLAYIAETGAIGSLDHLVFGPPTGSTWFVYNEPAPGSYRATAKTDIGSFSKNSWIQTSFSGANINPIHTTNNVAACSKMIPYFEMKASGSP
jgi:hypothetical protein